MIKPILQQNKQNTLCPATSMLILTVSGLKVLGPVLAQGPVNC